MPIKPQLLDAMKNTYTLTSLALGIAIFFGFLGGILAAKYHGSYIDRCITNVSLFFISIPHFFLGPLLILMIYKCLILKFPNSLDITLDIEFKADFDEAYEPLPKSPSIDDVDDTKTILPDFFLSINFTICCVKYI